MALPIPRLSKSNNALRIGLVGKMGTGKTYLATHLVNERNFKKVALADKLKAIAYEMYGVKGKDGRDREILQGLGSDLRKYDTDVWLKYYLNTVKYMEDGETKHPPSIVTDDVRYLNEANELRNQGFVLIRVVANPEIVEGRLAALYPNRPAATALHASETEQESIQVDHTIVNEDINGILDLDALVDKLRFEA